jgi:hypothetical protein
MRFALRQPTAIALLAAAFLAFPALAQASHIMGGSMELTVTADDRLQGTVTYSERDDCTVGNPSFDLNVELTDPTSASNFISVPTTYVRCVPGQVTMQGNFDVAITDVGLAIADGVYSARFANCCRVGGIINAVSASGDTEFRAEVTRVAGQSTSSPRFSSFPATGIAVGYEYLQNLNAFSPGGLALTYVSQVGPPTGPDFDVVTFEPDGDVFIPASTTSTFADGEFYLYKVRVADADGGFAERDVLLFITDQNDPPTFSGLPTQTIEVEPGASVDVPVEATDPQGGQTVSVLAAGLPSWASFSATPGNPASGTLTFAPPAGTPIGTTSTIGLDATDDFPDVPLSASATVAVAVVGDTAGDSGPPPARQPSPLQSTIAGAIAALDAKGRLVIRCSAARLRFCRVRAIVRTIKRRQPKVVVARQRKPRTRTIALGEANGTDEMLVKLGFSRLGRKLIRNRIGGRQVDFVVDGVTEAGEPLSDSFRARVRPHRNTILTRRKDLELGSGKVELTATGRARIRRIAGRLAGGLARSVRCTGYAKRRATARNLADLVCAELREAGIASSAEAGARRAAANRVAITVVYR